jgi:hypothetical protein
VDNPYQTPEYAENPFASFGSPQGDFRFPPGLMRHVRVIAVLMIVQGSLELLMALFSIAGLIMFRAVGYDNPMHNSQMLDSQMFDIVFAIQICFVIGIFCIGCFRIVAGLKNWRYRGRTLGIVALVCGCFSLCTGWCAPTSIGLFIYGLIVYLNQSSAEAFRLGDSGCSVEQIQASFY